MAPSRQLNQMSNNSDDNGSDNEYNGHSNSNNMNNRRRRTRITEEQLKVLRQYFDINKSPSDEHITDIAQRTHLQAKVIKHWFRNTLFKERQKDKDSPYNFNNPPVTQLNLEEYEKTGKIVSATNNNTPTTPAITTTTTNSETPSYLENDEATNDCKENNDKHFETKEPNDNSKNNMMLLMMNGNHFFNGEINKIKKIYKINFRKTPLLVLLGKDHF